MYTSTKKNVQLLVKHFIEQNVTHVVFSPGSRNAPLIIAFNNVPSIKCIVIPDERSAAFFALGIAQQTNSLVAIACTSGSAPLNYYPAISEAYYQNIPLLVLTADRPEDMVNQGDGQTIVQKDLYKNHINYSTSIAENANESFISRELSAAFHHAKNRGPVHINIPFTEPLYEKNEVNWDNIKIKHIEQFDSRNTFSQKEKHRLETIWKQSSKIMILVGQMNFDVRTLELLKSIAQNPAVTILVENTSNLVDINFIHCIDRTLNTISEENKSDFAPDLLITFGGAVVSKKIKAYLRAYKPQNHWKIGNDFPFMDTFNCLTINFKFSVNDFLEEIKQFDFNYHSNYHNKWKQIDFLVQEKALEYFVNNKQHNDLNVWNYIMDVIPEDSHLHIANSSVIRYTQLFDPIRTIRYWCNRGTSGIDGSVSTAAGAAFASQDKWHTLLTGDLSFFYDSNGLWHHNLTPNLRIFLVNNEGGGIFKIIPGPDSTDELEKFFVFENTFTAENICKTFNVGYYKAQSLLEIEQQIEEFYTYEENGKPKLMEIFTDKDLNPKELEAYWKNIRVD